jgi:hypothetical protein
LYAVRIVAKVGHVPNLAVLETAVAKGIEWSIDQGISVVNVSYSIDGAEEDGPLARACRLAFERGMILVSSYRNRSNKPVYPAAFAHVIGASRGEHLDVGEIEVVSRANKDIEAWGGPFSAAYLRNTIARMEGSSYASAQVAAMVGRLLTVDNRIGLEQVFRCLEEVALPRKRP